MQSLGATQVLLVCILHSVLRVCAQCAYAPDLVRVVWSRAARPPDAHPLAV